MTKLTNITLELNDFLENIKKLTNNELQAFSLKFQSQTHGPEIGKNLLNLPFWQDVDSVLDIGCGPGELTQVLSQQNLLKNKQYTGIDIQNELIKMAKEKNLGESIKFLHSDFREFQHDPFDVVFLMSVLQHLGDIKTVIPHLSRLTKIGGHLVCFDTTPQSFRNGSATIISTPDIPILLQMFNAITLEKTSNKRNDRCLVDMYENADSHGLKVIDFHQLKIEIGNFSRKSYMNWALCISEIIKRRYSVYFDQEKLLEQLVFWFESDGTAVINGVGMLVLQKIY